MSSYTGGSRGGGGGWKTTRVLHWGKGGGLEDYLCMTSGHPVGMRGGRGEMTFVHDVRTSILMLLRHFRCNFPPNVLPSTA